MSIRVNLLANYTSQLYVGLIAILLIPVYINLMGKEAYGLVGFFITVQSLFLVLDFGLSSTAIKQITLYRGGKLSAIKFRSILRGIEIVFMAVAIVILIIFLLSAKFIVNEWFTFEKLLERDVYVSVLLIGILASLRWLYSFYRGIVNGFEKITFLSWFGALIATMKYIFVIAALLYIDSGPVTFFSFQIIVAFFEIFVITLVAYKELPSSNVNWSLTTLKKIKPVFKFAFSVGIISGLWVIISQYDKGILSGWMNLSDYGIYMMLVLGASVITYFNSGMYNVLLPRISILTAENKFTEIKETYTLYTEVILLIVSPVASIMIIYSSDILTLWTNQTYAPHVYNTFGFLVLGNLFVPLLAFPYILQYAYSNFRVSLVNNFLVALLLPIGVWIGFEYFETVGVAINWAILMFVSFMLTSYFVHQRFFENFHLIWIFYSVTPIILVSFISAYSISIITKVFFEISWGFIPAYPSVLILSLLASSKVRNLIKRYLGQ